MAIVLEDGTGVEGANSYASVADADEYFSDRGSTTWSAGTPTTKAEALIRATAAIDATYGNRFTGYRSNGRDQELQWPRTQAYDQESYLLPSDEVPTEVVKATFEASVRELAEPGSMAPDLERGGQVKSLKAGSVAIEYGDNADATTTYTLIDGILSGLLVTGDGGGLFAIATRG